jgi:hypothetical protein
MTEYPFSSLSKHRRCTDDVFENATSCSNFPCIHTSCQDPDWLSDGEDLLRDPEFYYNLWASFRSPEEYKSRLSPQEWSECEAKFPRCRRLEGKEQEIDAALAAHRKWRCEAEDIYFEKQIRSLPEDVQKVFRVKLIAEQILADKFVDEMRRQQEESGLQGISLEEWILINKDLPDGERDEGWTSEEMVEGAKQDLLDLYGPHALDRLKKWSCR